MKRKTEPKRTNNSTNGRHALILILILCLVVSARGQETNFRFYGLKIIVRDLESSQRFYQDILNLDVVRVADGLKIDGQVFPIVIEEADTRNQQTYPQSARTGLTLQVQKLLPAIDELRAMKIPLYDTLLARNGVGISIPVQDPSGNVINLIEVQVYDPGKINGFKLYNTGVTISNMDSATVFYQSILGLEDWSRNYLPAALPLKHKDGSFAFMIHNKAGLKNNEQAFDRWPQMHLILTTTHLKQARAYLESSGIEITEKDDRLICQDYEGNWLEIFEVE